MEDRLYQKSDDISTERDAQISTLLLTGESDKLKSFLKKGETLRFVNQKLYSLITAFNSCYRQPNKQLEGLKALKKYGLTKAKINGESLELKFLGIESKVHPVKALFDPSDDLIKSLEDYDKRAGKCHHYCLNLANRIKDECSVLTGFIYGYTNKNKYLHSVIRIKVGDKWGIIDTTMNSLMSEDFYKKLTDFEVLTEVSSSTIKKDVDLLSKNESNNFKEYFLHRDEYMKELQEKQKFDMSGLHTEKQVNDRLNECSDEVCKDKK